MTDMVSVNPHLVLQRFKEEHGGNLPLLSLGSFRVAADGARLSAGLCGPVPIYEAPPRNEADLLRRRWQFWKELVRLTYLACLKWETVERAAAQGCVGLGTVPAWDSDLLGPQPMPPSFAANSAHCRQLLNERGTTLKELEQKLQGLVPLAGGATVGGVTTHL